MKRILQRSLYSRRLGERRRWCLAKNPGKLLSKWMMWSSSSWSYLWFNAHHAYTTFLKEHFFARAVNLPLPIRTRSSQKHHSSVHPRFPQEEVNAVRTCGRRTTKCCKRRPRIYRQSQFAHNLSDAWVRYLDHLVKFIIYHNSTQQQRERHKNLLYLRSVDENRLAPPLPQRPGYQEANEQPRSLQKGEKRTISSFYRGMWKETLTQQDWSFTARVLWEPGVQIGRNSSQRQQPSFSSSWSPSSTWWSSSSWTPSSQRWHQHSWQDD